MTRSTRNSVIVLGLAAIGAILAVYLWPRPQPPASGLLEVPLGVEEAVILTSDSGAFEAVPFAWGAGINVRISRVKSLPAGQVYDVRYIVNRAGDFDLKDYLRYSDGRPPEGLPSFKVRGLERLSKEIGERIAETEDTKIGLRGGYYRMLWLLGAGWVAWLLLLVFWRKRKPLVADAVAAGPTLLERIRTILAQLEAGTLDARQRAELELMIFRQWRKERSWGDRPMAETLAAFRNDPEVAEAYAALEGWLHRSEPATSPVQVAEAVRAKLSREPQGVAP